MYVTKKSTSDHVIKQGTFSIDLINSLIQHATSSFKGFQRKVPAEIKIQLLKELGYVVQNIIKSLIKIHTTETLQVKSMHFFDILISNFSPSTYNQQNTLWLSHFFEANNIHIP
jgi:hypothetical protein